MLDLNVVYLVLFLKAELQRLHGDCAALWKIWTPPYLMADQSGHEAPMKRQRFPLDRNIRI